MFTTRRHVIKLYPPFWELGAAAEATILGHVDGQLGVATPGVVATGHLEGWPYLVTEADAIALVRHFNRLGLAGVDLGQTLREAKLRAAQPRSHQTVREVLPVFVDEMVRIGEIRRSTAKGYKNRLAVWAYPAIGDVA